ncbi:MAG: hypothetical protein KA250_17580 [Verrucomicrobiales bacterium]|nr:hypothetical protein [Verrucomicrobiales bacterium]MBP9225469.1 hypothetical protein [Verrucomicrobiales bacterium]HQZ28416.1 hypothetical protein [Verrucomicrobiales bacterium]
MGHQIFEGDWKKVTVGGDGETVAVGTYEVGVTGVGGTIAASGSHWHGIVAIASTNGTAFSGDGGVAVSSSKGSHSLVGQCGYAYSKGGKATAGACSVAGTAGGHSIAAKNGISVGWFSNTSAARVEAGAGGVVIGNTGCFLKTGVGGVLIAMALPRKEPAITPSTKMCRVGEDGIVADTWYQIIENGNTEFEFIKQRHDAPS